MANYTKELQQVINSEESKDLISTMSGELASTNRQLKNGTLVYKEPIGKKWLIYPGGYIRVDTPHTDRLYQVHNPDGEHNYDKMGIDYYLDFAIPLIKKKYLNLKRLDTGKWEKLSNKGRTIIEGFFTSREIHNIIIQYFQKDRNINRLYSLLKEL